MPVDPRKGLDDISDSQRKKGNIKFYVGMGILGAFFLLFAVAAFFGISTSTPSSNNVSESNETYDDTLWVPTNFTAWDGDSNVAWRWLEADEFECDYGDGCWGIMVTSRDGCPSSLYAELTLFDNDGVQVGYTNENVGSLYSGDKAKLIFTSFEEAAEKGRLAEISCY